MSPKLFLKIGSVFLVVIFALLLIFTPITAKQETYVKYKDAAQKAGLDYGELLSFDAARTDNYIDSENPYKDVLYFMRLSYEQKIRITYHVPNSKFPIYVWVVQGKMDSQSYEDNLEILKKLKYNGDYTNLMDFIKDSNISNVTFVQTVSIRYILYEEVVSKEFVDDEMKYDWATELNYCFQNFFGQDIDNFVNVSEDHSAFVDNGKYFQNPTPPYKVISKYGNRFHPVYKKYKMHNGVDVAAPMGYAIHAAHSGKVTIINRLDNNDAGIYLVLEGTIEGKTVRTAYCHMSKVVKYERGQNIKKGQIIGYVGETGTATGPHLHLTMKVNSQLVDPELYIDFN